MMLKSAWAIARRCLVVLTVLGGFAFVNSASATMLLPVGNEQDSWSDIVIGGSTVIYDGATFSATRGSQATQIEIGGEFGPSTPSGSNPSTSYGVNGAWGGLGGGSPLLVSFDLLGVDINSSGVVTDGGSLTVTYTGPPAGTFSGDLADDYGIDVGDTLLEGTVIEVLLGGPDAPLDILFSITGGALQTGTNSEPSLAGVPFATGGLGVLRIAGGTPSIPADWSSPFTVNSPTINLLGIPEPSSMGLGMIGVILTMVRRSKRRD